MEKIEKCPHCGIEPVPITLRLRNPRLYEDENKPPDTRTYDVICCGCLKEVDSSTIDNTLKDMKKLRDEMDSLYGQSVVLPL